MGNGTANIQLQHSNSDSNRRRTWVRGQQRYSCGTATVKATIAGGPIVAGDTIIFPAKFIKLEDSIIAAGEEIHLLGMKEVECENSYIGAKKIYTDNMALLEEIIEDCRVEGEIKLINHSEEL